MLVAVSSNVKEESSQINTSSRPRRHLQPRPFRVLSPFLYTEFETLPAVCDDTLIVELLQVEHQHCHAGAGLNAENKGLEPATSTVSPQIPSCSRAFSGEKAVEMPVWCIFESGP